MQRIRPAALVVPGAVIIAGILTVAIGYRAAISANGQTDQAARQRSAPDTEGLTADESASLIDRARQWKESNMETATFAAGCFWGIEAAFRRLDGVVDTEVGYTGGDLPDPNYRQVCQGGSGHAEAVRVLYDLKKITYEDLLRAFWQTHDPTQLNRQGPDVGEQYRSAIFHHDEAQQKAAEQSKQRVNRSNKYRGRVVTQIVPAGKFYRAEEYHQRYLEKHGAAACPTGH